MQWNTDYKHTKHQKWWRTLLSVLTAVSWNTPPDRDCLHIPSEPELEPCWRKQKTGERRAGAGAGTGHLSPLVGRKAAAWCSCCRLDTGLVTTLPLWWPGVQWPGAPGARPGEDVPSDGHLWPDPLRGHTPGLRVPAAAALLREVLRARHHRHRRHRHRDQGQQRRVQNSAVRGVEADY